jgi:hypothetical protein
MHSKLLIDASPEGTAPAQVGEGIDRLNEIAGDSEQTEKPPAPTNITPPYTSSPSPPSAIVAIDFLTLSPTSSDKDGGRDVSACLSKRQHKDTSSDEVDEEDHEPETPRAKKKVKVTDMAEDAVNEPKRSTKPKKPKVYDASKELDRMEDAEQARLVNAPNKYLKAMGKWDFVKVRRAHSATNKSIKYGNPYLI